MDQGRIYSYRENQGASSNSNAKVNVPATINEKIGVPGPLHSTSYDLPSLVNGVQFNVYSSDAS